VPCVRSRTACSRPLHTTRGIGADCIVVDELAFVPGEFFGKVILPIAGNMLGASLICVSTRNKSTDIFDVIIKQRDDNGELILDVHRFSEHVCPACETQHGLKHCEHAAAMRPMWVSGEKQRRIGRLRIGAANEMAGAVDEGVPNAFDGDAVGDLLSSTPRAVGPAPIYYIGVDPNQGGVNSRCGIVAAKLIRPPDSDSVHTDIIVVCRHSTCRLGRIGYIVR